MPAGRSYRRRAGSAFEGSPGAKATWRLTDDTQLTLATCEALLEGGAPSPARLAATFVRWYRTKRLSGLGSSTRKALQDLHLGAHWAIAGRQGEGAAGNGAAMRIAPLAFCLDLQRDKELLRDICRITHHSDEAYAGALAVAVAIRLATRDCLSLGEIPQYLPDTRLRDRLIEYSHITGQTPLLDIARRFGTSGYVVESVPFALLAAERASMLGFEEMLRQVIAAGGDTDTNASLAGQVAGTAAGLSGLPAGLVDKLPDADLVYGIARPFAATIQDTY